MNTLVIGGAGFIGSHLCDALVARNDFVVVIDNLMRGKVENIQHLLVNKKFIFIKGDAADEENIVNIITKYKIDYIYHLAANSDIQASSNNPDIEFRCTTKTTWSVLSVMRKTGVKKLFFASTSAVYGDYNGKLNEEKTVLRPVSYYGSAKMASEAFINAFSFMNDFDILVFRFPNVVGPRLTHGVIFDFVNKLINNCKTLEVLGNGNQEKQYIYISDLIEAIIKFDINNKGINVFNVGVETSTTIKFIAEEVVKAMKLCDCKIVYGTTDYGWKGDIPKFEFDVSKIHSFGWKGRYSSNESIVVAIKQHLNEISYNGDTGKKIYDHC